METTLKLELLLAVLHRHQTLSDAEYESLADPTLRNLIHMMPLQTEIRSAQSLLTPPPPKPKRRTGGVADWSKVVGKKCPRCGESFKNLGTHMKWCRKPPKPEVVGSNPTPPTPSKTEAPPPNPLTVNPTGVPSMRTIVEAAGPRQPFEIKVEELYCEPCHMKVYRRQLEAHRRSAEHTANYVRWKNKEL